MRNKAIFAHDGVAEGAFVRDKAVRTHRVRVPKDTVRDKAVRTHRVRVSKEMVRDKDGSAHGAAIHLCVTKPVSYTGKGKEARVGFAGTDIASMGLAGTRRDAPNG